MFQFVFTQLISKKNKQTNKKEQRAEKGSEINRGGKRIKQQTEDCVVKKKKIVPVCPIQTFTFQHKYKPN